MVRPRGVVVREAWDIHYDTSYGRLGTALLTRLTHPAPSEVRAEMANHVLPWARLLAIPGELSGTIAAFSSTRDENGHWCVTACIAFDNGCELFGRIVTEKRWTRARVAREIRIGKQVVLAGANGPVASLADIRFTLVESG